MAAYAALVSLMHTIDEIEHHPRPPISFKKNQLESLTENVTFLQEFLEGYYLPDGYSKEADPLEMRIADAAYAVEVAIKSHVKEKISSQILPPFVHDPKSSSARANTRGEIFSLFKFFKSSRSSKKAGSDHDHDQDAVNRNLPDHHFCRSLQKGIEDMDSIKKAVMEIKEKTGVRDQLLRSSVPAGYTGQNVSMVGFDDISVEIMDQLTGGECERRIIPIVGMGGTGKTTLATNIYQHQVVVQHFDFRAWVTVSQRYKMREILLELLPGGGRDLSQFNEHELGDQLHKRLFGRRYLIIIDDIWDTEVWDHLRRFFPDNKNGSRIVITTRISDFESTSSYVFKMGFLDKDNSWSLFSKIVFEEEDCPLELEGIGRKIVESCGGLPLSIVVVGGILAKSEITQGYWSSIAKNLNSIVNSEDDERCLKILHMSYNELPAYLKPCFLYMGVFSEDEKIRVSELIKLWVAEGFLKPISGKSSEEVADEYLHELINRNLVLAHELGSIGNVKYCKTHDLLRDLCLRQAKKERFLNVNRNHIRHAQPLTKTREDLLKFVNSRFLVFKVHWAASAFFPYIHWNLQTLIIQIGTPIDEIDIWKLPQLRHLKVVYKFKLPDVPSGNVRGQDQDYIVLRNLRTLGRVHGFNCNEEMVKRIPNIKKLNIDYMPRYWEGEEQRNYCADFGQLSKLESLSCRKVFGDCLQSLSFPNSLKKLSLRMDYVNWEDELGKVGSLPSLVKFNFEDGCFRGGKWETVEGQFPSLRFLSIKKCSDLRYWRTESSHFPRLEHLVLHKLEELEEIPSEIGEIPTLKSIKVEYCSTSTVISAEKILEEQEELFGEVFLQVHVITMPEFGSE